MKLGLFFMPVGHQLASWRHRDSADIGIDIHGQRKLAETAERGLMDMIFIADSFGITPGAKRTAHLIALDPVTTLSALAMVTRHIGLVGTATTTYNEPFNIARRFASLDHISGGRAGWNIVTSFNPAEATNFGLDAPIARGERYRRAQEFVEVVRGLWDSWDDDAFPRDRASGLFFDPAKMHPLYHIGTHYKVSGPLNLPRSPQGQPILVQAGLSDDGRDLAAGVADVIFTVHRELAPAQAFYHDVKARASAVGRDPAQVLVMPGILPFVARTRHEARDQQERMLTHIHPEAGLDALSRTLGVDLMNCDPDAPVPDIPTGNLPQSRAVEFVHSARREKLTLRQLYERVVSVRGHHQVTGTPGDIADVMQHWFENGAADGFNVMPPIMPGGLDDFVDLVVPELQRRGLYRTAYEGPMLRDQLGLPRPRNRFSA
jgi:FMN-dependent oxidoreductase (nitrilotriacetate monooxygenase family)